MSEIIVGKFHESDNIMVKVPLDTFQQLVDDKRTLTADLDRVAKERDLWEKQAEREAEMRHLYGQELREAREVKDQAGTEMLLWKRSAEKYQAKFDEEAHKSIWLDEKLTAANRALSERDEILKEILPMVESHNGRYPKEKTSVLIKKAYGFLDDICCDNGPMSKSHDCQKKSLRPTESASTKSTVPDERMVLNAKHEDREMESAERVELMDFKKDIAMVINRHSKENGSDTPDFILAQYLSECLKIFNTATNQRENRYTRSLPDGQTGKL